MKLPLPENAETILRARMKGLRPSDMVIVSLLGAARTSNPLVLARPDAAFDWRWVRGLEVCLYVDDQPNWYDTLKDIAVQRPAYLGLWNASGQWGADAYLIPTAEDIAKPVPEWAYELDFLPWLDFQNTDFHVGRRYARTPEGLPYAVDP